MTGKARLAKLRAMSLREVLTRSGYAAYTFYERDRHRRGRLVRPDRLQKALVPSLAARADWQDAVVNRVPQTRFFAGTEAADAMRVAFRERYGDELRTARRIADEVARGEVSFFGQRFHVGPDTDWHADPTTGASWPRRYHGDVQVHGGNVGFGDVKDVWELNRHQFFVDLAKVAFIDGSSVHADAVHGHLMRWIAQVPYGTGVPWACALEPAFRAWSWMWSYHLLRGAGMVGREEHLLWLTGFSDHGRFLFRHLELYSSPFNHLVGEASALFALGVLFPEFREAALWKQRGKGILESAVSAQFHTDGGAVEQSSFYHHATLGGYLLAAVLGRRNGVDLAPEVWNAVESAIAFSAAIIQPDGRTPRIGGADDGKPIRMEHLPLWDFRYYQAIGAVLFSRGDFRAVAGRFWEDALWILGPEGEALFERLPPREPATVAALPASGYFVARSDWSGEADYLCFDCGDQAAGLRRDGVPSAAHGHADCLSVMVALGGREVLVDPGFYCYNGDPDWEVGFRRTSAHNTIAIDGMDQAQHISKMAWSRTYSAQQEGWAGESLGWARASHDGYARLSEGVSHRRTVWLRDGGYVIMVDELTGTGTHYAEAVFQFAPGTLELDGTRVVFQNRYEMVWIGSAPAHARLSEGGPTPTSGWVAPSLGIRAPAPRLALEMPFENGRMVLLTVLADTIRLDTSSGQERIAAGRATDGSLWGRVEGRGFADDVVAAVEGPATMADVETDAPLVVVRRRGEKIAGVKQAGGTYVRLIPPPKGTGHVGTAVLEGPGRGDLVPRHRVAP